LTVMLVIDVSPSSYFGTDTQMKNEVLTEIAAVLAFSAINNNDKVGVIFFSDQIEKFLPPKKGKSHILRIIRELINIEPKGTGTNISVALEYLNNVIKKRSTAFVMSDFMAKEYDTSLRIAARRHDIIGVHLFDPREQTIPNVGLVRVLDAETGQKIWLDTSSKKIREEYANWFQGNADYLKKTFLKTGADVVSIQTNESYVNALMKFFKKRKG